MTDAVLLEELPTASGHRFGIATLNAPASLNALSLPMVRLLAPALRGWAQDPGIAGVVLRGEGTKAFCAGGDLRALHASIGQYGSGPNLFAQQYFAQEYELDHMIHGYAKPLLCWGGGIVMGGGVGLMVGASHRVVTPTSRLAMPEISIGLYPDVGGSWFLRRLPGRVGLFMALTGAQLNAADAMFCGLADVCMDDGGPQAVLDAIAGAPWRGSAHENRAALSRLLATRAAPEPAPSQVAQHLEHINVLMDGDDLAVIAARLRGLRGLQGSDPWLAGAAETFAGGSPTSAALSFALWQRVRGLSLADVLRLEYRVSLGCCAHPDFAEGVRALLIDKDRSPRWTPATLEQVTAQWIAAHFEPRFAPPQALAALD